MGDTFFVGEHGFVSLVDVMGDDTSIVQAARTSYGKGTKTSREDAGLIRYLMRHQHTTPFEMVEFKFHIKCPIFVMRQWIRHRTASVNEYSGRYSEMPDEFYIPEEFRGQDTINRQGSNDILSPETQFVATSIVDKHNKLSYDTYEDLLKNDVSRETARIVLPVSIYTSFYWKINLHNLFHFLKLRMDSHAQSEIRGFAVVVATFVREHVPLAWEAFEEYVLDAVTLSRGELESIKELLQTEYVPDQLDSLGFDYFHDNPSEKTVAQRKHEILEKLGLL